MSTPFESRWKMLNFGFCFTQFQFKTKKLWRKQVKTRVLCQKDVFLIFPHQNGWLWTKLKHKSCSRHIGIPCRQRKLEKGVHLHIEKRCGMWPIVTGSVTAVMEVVTANVLDFSPRHGRDNLTELITLCVTAVMRSLGTIHLLFLCFIAFY